MSPLFTNGNWLTELQGLSDHMAGILPSTDRLNNYYWINRAKIRKDITPWSWACLTAIYCVLQFPQLRPNGFLSHCHHSILDGARHSTGARAQLPGPKIPGWAGCMPLPLAEFPAPTATWLDVSCLHHHVSGWGNYGKSGNIDWPIQNTEVRSMQMNDLSHGYLFHFCHSVHAAHLCVIWAVTS
jgi:hypothetical protein